MDLIMQVIAHQNGLLFCELSQIMIEIFREDLRKFFKFC